MSYTPLMPFTPNATFKVLRPLNIDGKDYGYDEILPDGLDERFLQLLYTQRRIDIVGPKEAKPKRAAEKPAEPAAVVAEKPADEARYRVKQAGLGGFKVIGPDGVVGTSHKTYAEAKAEADRLNAL